MRENCRLCPRKCSGSGSVCGGGEKAVVAKTMLHQWEEPCISVKNGAGAVFFSGCSLHCCYCQNNAISSRIRGREVSERELADIFLRLQQQGADNIELITPTHFSYQILRALDLVKHKLKIPVIYNTGGYELPETIELFRDYIDVYLPDLKYYSPEVSGRYSNAFDYFKYAHEAVLKMTEQAGELTFDDNGALIKGTVIRHLVLPGQRHDSMKILDWIAANIPGKKALVSIMSQYTPFEFISDQYPELKRRITKMEYNSVVRHAERLGINGFTQQKSSSSEIYVPDF